MKNVTVAYSGVHQAYQIALAAQEVGLLDKFFCSIFVAPGKWGQRLRLLFSEESLSNRKCDGLPSDRVCENPWPVLLHRLKLGLLGANFEPWTAPNLKFDRWAASQLENSNSRVIVGSETCARDCFRMAKAKGMIRVLDAPQVEAGFLSRALRRAHESLGIQFSGKIDNDEMVERKQEELCLADRILTYSEIHRRSFLEAGISPERLIEIPLWANSLGARPCNYDASTKRPLQVLFVGGIGIRKGVPWLLEAAKQLFGDIRLRLLGRVDDEFSSILQGYERFYEYVPPQPRPALAHYYARADVLVLPSIVDSFGFVAMEAMLLGVPVIVSTNCGLPVPDESWRVPIMDSEAIAERLTMYSDDRALLAEHGKMAKNFARRFTPARYRDQIGRFLIHLLSQ